MRLRFYTVLPSMLALALVHGLASGAELGRLFLSPAERAAIDSARQGVVRARAMPAAVTADDNEMATAAVLEAPAAAVTVNGYIARSAGAATVWINGRDGAPGKLSAPARDGQRVNVPLKGNGGQVALKPGQSFDPASRQVSDAYQQQRPPAVE